MKSTLYQFYMSDIIAFLFGITLWYVYQINMSISADYALLRLYIEY